MNTLTNYKTTGKKCVRIFCFCFCFFFFIFASIRESFFHFLFYFLFSSLFFHPRYSSFSTYERFLLSSIMCSLSNCWNKMKCMKTLRIGLEMNVLNSVCVLSCATAWKIKIRKRKHHKKIILFRMRDNRATPHEKRMRIARRRTEVVLRPRAKSIWSLFSSTMWQNQDEKMPINVNSMSKM